MFRPLAFLLLAAACAGPRAFALPFVWISPAAGNWSVGANWRDGAPPPAGGAADFDLVFRPRGGSGTFNSTNDLGAFELRTLSFQTGRGYGLGGVMAAASTVNSTAALRFTATEGAAIMQSSGGDVRVNAPLDFGVAVELGGDGLGVVQLAGRLTGAGALSVDRGTGRMSILGNAFTDPGSTFSGGVNLLSGTLLIDSAGALGTGALRSGGAGTFGVSPFAGARDFTVPNPIEVGGSLRITGTGSLTLTGVISGGGRLVVDPDRGTLSPPVIRVAAPATFTGDLVVQPLAAFTVNGAAGGFSTAASVTVSRGATFEVDDRAGAANRLPDAGPLNLAGGATLTYRSGANRTSAETIGPLRTSGMGTVSLNPDSAEAQSSAVMTSAAWQPAVGSITIFQGRGLGGQAPGTAGSDNFLFANAAAVQATQIGGGGAAGTPTISILPQAVTGNPIPGQLVPLVFATYDAVRGIRPLAGAEVSTAITDGAQTLTNVRLLSSITLNQPTRINALALDLSSSGSLTGSISGSGTLTVASGLVIMSPRNSQLSVAEIAFGAQRGTIFTSLVPAIGGPASSPATISSRLTGSNGLTIAGAGTISLTGTNQIDGGLLIAAPVSASSLAALGGSGPIELNGGSLFVSGGGTLNRDLVVSGGGTLNGAITHTGALQGAGELNVQGVTLAGSGSTFSGTVQFSSQLTIGSSGALGSGATLRAIVGAASPELRVLAPVSLAGGLELFSNTISGNLTVTVDSSLTLGGVRMTRFTPGLLGGITKQGVGTMTVIGDLDVRGPIQVSAGTLMVYGQVAAPGSGAAAPLIVSAGAVFGGSARVFRDVSLGGMLRPGSMGIVDLLRIDGTLSAAAGSAFEWDHAADGGDVVDVAGSLAFSGGTVTFRLRALDAALPSGFDLLVRTGEGITGTLPVFALDFTDASAWASLGLYVQPVGNDLYLVPEPAPIALLAAGALALGIGRRWRWPSGPRSSEAA